MSTPRMRLTPNRFLRHVMAHNPITPSPNTMTTWSGLGSKSRHAWKATQNGSATAACSNVTASEVVAVLVISLLAPRALRADAPRLAREPRRDGHPVAHLEARHAWSNLVDDPDDLVPHYLGEREERLHWIVNCSFELQFVHVTAANPAVDRLHNHPVVCHELGARHLLDADGPPGFPVPAGIFLAPSQLTFGEFSEFKFKH